MIWPFWDWPVVEVNASIAMTATAIVKVDVLILVCSL